MDPTSHASGESTAAEEAGRPPEERRGIENGEMDSTKVWHQEAKDEAELILKEESYARLGDYDDGRDDL